MLNSFSVYGRAPYQLMKQFPSSYVLPKYCKIWRCSVLLMYGKGHIARRNYGKQLLAFIADGRGAC